MTDVQTTDSLLVSRPAAERKTRKRGNRLAGKKRRKTLSTLLWVNEAEVTQFTKHQ